MSPDGVGGVNAFLIFVEWSIYLFLGRECVLTLQLALLASTVSAFLSEWFNSHLYAPPEQKAQPLRVHSAGGDFCAVCLKQQNKTKQNHKETYLIPEINLVTETLTFWPVRDKIRGVW